MTEIIWGVDISNHQPNINPSRIRAEGFTFAFVKASEGTGYRDPYFKRHYRACIDAGLQTGAYIYVRAGSPAAQQAAVFHSVVADTSIPVALDIEEGAGADSTLFYQIRDELQKIGYRVVLTYIPRWYWQKIGQPDLTGLPPLWTSAYPDNNSGAASLIYQRAGSSGWRGYGGLEVAVWQFTSSARVAGHTVDANAVRDPQILRDIFGNAATKEQEENMKIEEVAAAVHDVQVQLRGPQLQGWSQLGQNAAGQNLTLVDAIAALRVEVSETRRELTQLRGELTTLQGGGKYAK